MNHKLSVISSYHHLILRSKELAYDLVADGEEPASRGSTAAWETRTVMNSVLWDSAILRWLVDKSLTSDQL